MKYTRSLDAVRNIRRHKASYISIVLIAFLGVAAFLSMSYSSYALKKAASKAYREMEFRELEIVSPLMLTQEDLKMIRGTEGVVEAEPVYLSGGVALCGDAHKSVSVLSLTEKVNSAKTIRGAEPKESNECAVEQRLAQELDLKVGDEIYIVSSDGSSPTYLMQERFTVTGILLHPNHTNPTSPETPYILVAPDAFDHAALDDCIMAVEVKTAKDRAEVEERLTQLGRERYMKRHAALLWKQEEAAEPVVRMAETEGLLPKDTPFYEAVEIVRKKAETGEIPETYRKLVEEYINTFDRLNLLEKESWIINDETANIDYVSMKIDCENITKLELSFSLLFILIGAMVIYATIGKMIDEQREQIGGMKAFGMKGSEIFSKYLLFGVSSTAIGMLFGVLAARFVFEGFVLHSYSRYYTYDIKHPVIAWIPTGIVFIIGITLAVLAAYIACRRLLRLAADRLIRPQVPQFRPKASAGRLTMFSLYGRLIFRNMRSDKKRIAVTVAAVAGCCALIVTGFTLKSSMSGSVARQYTQIVRFDEKIRYRTQEAGQMIEGILRGNGLSYVAVHETYIRYQMGDATLGRLWCGNLSKVRDYLQMTDWKTGHELKTDEKGVYIQRRIAEIYDLQVGDELKLLTEDLQTGSVRIAGIFENYIGSNVMMDRETFVKQFANEPEPNVFLVRTGKSEVSGLSEQIGKVEGFESMEAADAERTMFESLTSVVNGVILLLVFLAALMAAVVLSNLAHMYMLQKEKELTIMRINGFTVSETVGYMVRDTIITTLAGIVIGCAAGSGMAYYIIRSLEQPFTRMIRSVSPMAWLIGAGITLVFTVLVHAVILRKIKYMKLSDLTAA
ncbi:MAG: ABC transporter permease [Lachnospiraceae bacterium]|nr:ABC transporter permease [Lachnospiraceae bacterium]